MGILGSQLAARSCLKTLETWHRRGVSCEGMGCGPFRLFPRAPARYGPATRRESAQGTPMNAATRMAHLAWMISEPGVLGKRNPEWIDDQPILASFVEARFLWRRTSGNCGNRGNAFISLGERGSHYPQFQWEPCGNRTLGSRGRTKEGDHQEPTTRTGGAEAPSDLRPSARLEERLQVPGEEIPIWEESPR